MTSLPLARVHCILKKHLELGKINARWIPHLLTDDQKRSRVEKAKSLLKKYPKYSKKALVNFITGDETWVYFLNPKENALIESGPPKTLGTLALLKEYAP